jgi:hypothetical protein
VRGSMRAFSQGAVSWFRSQARVCEWHLARKRKTQDTTEGVLDRTNAGSLRGLRTGGSGFAGKRERRVVRRAALQAGGRVESIVGVCGRQRTSDDGSMVVKALPVACQRAHDAEGQHAGGREALPALRVAGVLFDRNERRRFARSERLERASRSCSAEADAGE